ncbi:MAG: hypothetical protein LC623_03850 [Halobacteriales archaeon]|nr:hypothetical protein [Halobacteriales archaeon]
MRWLLAVALLALLPGCLATQPVKARLHNGGSDAVQVRLVATNAGATLLDQAFQVGGGQTVEHALGAGTMTVKATYTAHHAAGGSVQDVDASVALTLGGGDCADGTAVAAFSFSYNAGAGAGAFRNDGVKVVCE